ncbi:MAG: type II toxin-antitoxin system VapC family toxin [Candidatus Poribacteria bacterium]|nr:type II toxin-antitoxin system VapC family toxin [Candidatus Poribacteria bacterium]
MIVVDCSVLIAGLLPDEVEKQAQLLLEDLQYGRTVAVVPSLFYQEISNALLMAYRRKRINRDVLQQYLDVITILPITVDTAAATQGSTMKRVCELAEEHGLTTYDASYLELASRLDLPLATLDADLYNVAVEIGVAYPMTTN